MGTGIYNSENPLSNNQCLCEDESEFYKTANNTCMPKCPQEGTYWSEQAGSCECQDPNLIWNGSWCEYPMANCWEFWDPWDCEMSGCWWDWDYGYCM